ncbi:MAG: hypothetical protein FJX75_01055 [Armatimonadetes bacterium]|nr:hypothetical protein [Armatimonadota bacterium]
MRTRRTITAACVSLALVGLLAWGVSGCGSSTGPVPPGGSLVHALSIGPYPPAGQYYRYRDILDHPYLFSPGDGSCAECYAPPALVTFTSGSGGATTLAGTLTAASLRPHFAYQVKLEGMPVKPYPWSGTDLADPPNWSNKQIGSVGRWWCNTCGWNVADNQLSRHRGHWVLGYLLFDFFITDIGGNALRDIHLDSSFHVLWRTDQRTPTANDGAPREHTVTYRSDVYSTPFSAATTSVYAEGEPNRPQPGQVTLPGGSYRCRLLLTEESFHNVPPALASQYPWGQTNYADGGFWAHALSDDQFAFTVGATPASAMHVGGITMGLQTRGSFTNATATVSVAEAGGAPVSGVLVAGRWSGVVTGTVSGTTDSSGQVTLSSAKTRSAGTFTFTVDSLSKSGWTYDSAANVKTSDSITKR